MTKYTSPTSSPVGQPGDIPPELAVLTALEAGVDAVRFRFEALENDLVQERPAGAERSMAEIMAQMRVREERFAEQLYRIPGSPPARTARAGTSRTFAFDTNYHEDLGQFLQLRQESLAVLRRFVPQQWQEQLEADAQKRSVLELAGQIAAQDANDLNELARLRGLLAGGSAPGTRGVVPE